MNSVKTYDTLIVGAGILGLSIAEFESRNGNGSNVLVVHSQQKKASSLAAAANLQTKGQRFARDPHFNLKLVGKQTLPHWLQSLIAEDLNLPVEAQEVRNLLNLIFSEGHSRESFDVKIEGAVETHLKRITQNSLELNSKRMSRQPIERESHTSILIGEEQWVDARALLSLLNRVLRKRGVLFQELLITNWKDLLRIPHKHLVLSPGVGILQLWKTLQLPSDPLLQKVRLSAGSVFYSERKTTQNIKQNNLFWEHTFSVFKGATESQRSSKVTLTFAGEQKLYASSTTLKTHPARISELENEEVFQTDEFRKTNADFLQLANKHPYFENIDQETQNWNALHGARIGFGHSEILVRSWPKSVFSNLNETQLANFPNRISVVCGAHKSGFCFAPLIGQELRSQKVQQ
jgi:hypothetical protein